MGEEWFPGKDAEQIMDVLWCGHILWMVIYMWEREAQRNEVTFSFKEPELYLSYLRQYLWLTQAW